MSESLSLIVCFVAGALLAGAAAWWLLRVRVTEALAQGQALSAAEVATLQERVWAYTAERDVIQASQLAQRDALESLRTQLENIRAERAQLLERAGRIETLEQQHRNLSDELRQRNAELAVQAGELADKGARLQAREQAFAALDQNFRNLDEECAGLQQSLQLVSTAKAALDEQCLRIPQLEAELKAAQANSADAMKQVANLREQVGQLGAAHKAAQEEVAALRQSLQQQTSDLALQQNENTSLKQTLAEQQTLLQAEREQTAEKLALLQGAREALTQQFKNLATEILEDKSKRFTEQNQTSLGQLLEPLKLKLQEFQGKVESVYDQENKDRSALAEQVRQLMSLNQKLSADAHNLTQALKGSSKTRGTWGELILEKVLEASGLQKGVEYVVQESHTREDGSRAQPDVVINLPENKYLIVDAKVSLNAYEAHASADDDAEREAALRRHLESVRNHIRELSARNYHELHGNRSPDFVLMFIPVEPAFMLAIANDPELWHEAWRKNVLLVSPSTLLFVVRTVAHLWRQEQQNRNAQDIATRGAELYDKLVGFVDDMQSLGNRLKQAQASYDGACNKLHTGRGNVIRQAELLRGLGVKPSKSLPTEFVEKAELSAEGLIAAVGEVEVG